MADVGFADVTRRARPHEAMTSLSPKQEELSRQTRWTFSDLRALFVNCTLKRSPELSNTQGLADISIEIMRRQGVTVDVVRAIDHHIATGVWPDMTEHGWDRDEWPAIFEQVQAAHILVLCTPIWLGEKSSVCTQVIERLYGNSHLLNDRGQYAYYGRVGGCLVTGNEDGVKHCAMNILYSLQHLGYVIPPQADAGWIGEAGPGPSYLDPGSGGPENDFTNRNTTFMTWNLLHLARGARVVDGVARQFRREQVGGRGRQARSPQGAGHEPAGQGDGGRHGFEGAARPRRDAALARRLFHRVRHAAVPRPSQPRVAG